MTCRRTKRGCILWATTFLEYSANGRLPTRQGNRRPGFAPHGVYPCQGQDAWCTMAVHSEAEWQALCRAMDHPAWTQEARFATCAAREQHLEALDAQVAAWTTQHTPQEVLAPTASRRSARRHRAKCA